MRRLYVRGLFPIVLCGQGTTSKNWIQHMNEVPKSGPLGGSFSVSRWAMDVLYEQWKLHRNKWSRANGLLDLVKYRGCTFKFWRHEYVDYLVSYSRNSPMTINEMTHMAAHPVNVLQSRHRVIVKSRQTKRRGRPYVRVRIKPPRLLISKWYFQQDFCMTNLLLMTVTACNLKNPWMRVGAVTPCLTFFCLKPSVYTNLSNTIDQSAQTTMDAQVWGNSTIHWQYWYTRDGQRWLQKFLKQGKTFKPDDLKDQKSWDENGFKETLQKARAEEEKDLTQQRKDLGITPNKPDTIPQLWHSTGLYSTTLLTPERLDPELPVPFVTVRYNPLTDMGIGNWIAVQSVSASQATISGSQYRYLFKEKPLWMLLFGYYDYMRKAEDKFPDFFDAYRLFLRCEYTNPPPSQK